MGSEEWATKRRLSEDKEGYDRKHRKRGDSDEKKEKRAKAHKHSRSREGKGKKSREKNKHSTNDSDSEKYQFQELTKDDYFSKNNEFATWLKEERGKYFSNLSSEDARELFLIFVKNWNRGKLESRYYEGITNGPRTAHNWKIRHEK